MVQNFTIKRFKSKFVWNQANCKKQKSTHLSSCSALKAIQGWIEKVPKETDFV